MAEQLLDGEDYLLNECISSKVLEQISTSEYDNATLEELEATLDPNLSLMDG